MADWDGHDRSGRGAASPQQMGAHLCFRKLVGERGKDAARKTDVPRYQFDAQWLGEALENGK